LTGTLSITISNRVTGNVKMKVRQFQSQNVLKEEHENLQALYLVDQFLKYN